MLKSEDILRLSKRELRAAAAAIQVMRSAKEFDVYRQGWQTFIDKLEKIWVKAERECRPFRSSFEPWQLPFKELRKSDSLLCYLHQARHADQHSLQITAGVSFGFTIVLPPSGKARLEIDEEKGLLTMHGGGQIVPAQTRLTLLPVKNRGIVFKTPEEHLGQKLEDATPHAVAERGLAFYADFLRQAEEKFFSAAPTPAQAIEGV